MPNMNDIYIYIYIFDQADGEFTGLYRICITFDVIMISDLFQWENYQNQCLD